MRHLIANDQPLQSPIHCFKEVLVMVLQAIRVEMTNLAQGRMPGLIMLGTGFEKPQDLIQMRGC